MSDEIVKDQNDTDLLSVLENRVMKAIELIDKIKFDNDQLRAEVERLQGEINLRDERIAELENRVQELLHFADDIERFKQERREATERLETILELLKDAAGDEPE